MERPSFRKKNRQNSIVSAEVASVPTEEVMFKAPVASVSLFVFSQFTSSLRSCSAA